MIWYKRILYFFCNTCRPNRSRTVRYAFPFVMGALVVLSALTISADKKTVIEIIPSQTTVKAGDVLSLDVFVNSHTPVNAIDITLDIPSSQLNVTGIDVGTSVITLWTVDPYVDGNAVVLRGGTFRKGFLGRHRIATINAKAISSGLAYINVTDSLLLAGDGRGTEVVAADNKNDETRLIIAKSDGTFEPGTEEASAFEANVIIRVVTDIDGDGIVTIADISRFMAAWFSSGIIYDFNGDGKMTFRDFSIILADSFRR